MIATVTKLLERHYGIEGDVHTLPGEHDLNFHIKAGTGTEYALKVHAPDADPSHIDLQNHALLHLAARDGSLPVPRPVKSAAGELVVRAALPDGSYRLLRLLSWLPGKVWAESPSPDWHRFAALGSVVARMDRALADFVHPALSRHHPWNVQNAAEHISMLPLVQGEEKRNAAAAVLRHFITHVEPKLASCARQATHNDANEYNVLVGPEQQITGIIDFGDIVSCPRICNLAVACAYAMLGQRRPLHAVLPLVAAYDEANPLSDAEFELLFGLVKTRLAMSICMAAAQTASQPHNGYLNISQVPVWSLLQRLTCENGHLAHFRFRNACGREANPSARAVVRWIESNSDRFSDICRFPMQTAPRIVLDPSPATNAGPAGVEALSERVFARIEESGSASGIGRYGEDRAPGQLSCETGECPEPRTVHLGMDVFLRPGEPVYAPLDGTVESFSNNAAPGDYGPVIILRHETTSGIPFWTLYGHLSVDSLDKLHAGRKVAKGENFGRVGGCAINGGWVPHVHFQILTHTLGAGCDIYGVAPRRDLDVWQSISPNPNIILGIPEECAGQVRRDRDYLLEQRRLHLGTALRLSYREPLVIMGGNGEYLYDEDGNAWLDMVNNVCHVGHCHPRVVAAAASQLARLNTNTRYLHPNMVEYARRLTATLPEPLSVCFFVNSGSEANDLALRLARAHTGAGDVCVIDHAYHGNLSSLIEISPYKFNGKGGTGRPAHVHVAPLPDGYRGPFKYSDPLTGARYASAVDGIVADLLAGGRGIAAFFAESLIGCGGQIVPPPGYLREAYRCVRAAGGICVADEVQVGLGRVGSHMWGFENQNVVPDIVTIGKPVGNGHPLGAVVTTRAIARSFDNGMEYFNTYGGNPVSCAVGLAVLDTIRDERLQQNARDVGDRLMSGLRELYRKHALIGDVRGAGLFIGVELVRDRNTLEPADREAAVLVERMKERRILLSIDGPLHNVLKIKPPLVFTGESAEKFLAALDEVLATDFSD